MIAAHGNSLRSIIMYLDKLTSQEVKPFVLTLQQLFFLVACSLYKSIVPFLFIYILFSIFKQVISLELSTGIPMLYIFKEGKFIRRGSPAGPAEAGVYAYTRVCNP